MPKTYTPKHVNLTYEEVDLVDKEYQQRISDAYDILFEETLKFVKEHGK